MAVTFRGKDLSTKFKSNPTNVAVRQYRIEYQCASATVTHYIQAADSQGTDTDGKLIYRDVLTYAENEAAGLTRTPTVKLYTQNANLKWSAAQTVEAINPIPSISAPTITRTFDGVVVSVQTPTDGDFEGFVAWLHTTSTVPLDDAHQCYKGKASAFTINLPDDTARYIRVAPYDAFGLATSAVTASQSVQRADRADAIKAAVPIEDMLVSIDDLVETYGNTLAAAASADAAADYATAAETARNQSQAARDLAAGHSTDAGTAKTAAEAAQSAASTQASNAATSATGAAGSATTATGQATIATTKAGEASTSASTASAQATIATTKAGQASTSASNAATSETNAAGSATSAATQAGVAATQATNAGSSATAAATSASNAAASQTAAGSSATAANTSATDAATQAGNASTSASNAASSAINAAGSATSAASSATVSATAATASQRAASSLLPSDFTSSLNWTSQYNAQYPSELSGYSFPNDSAGTFIRVTGVGGIWNRGYLPLQPNRTYRISVRSRVVFDPAGVGLRLYQDHGYTLGNSFAYDGGGFSASSGTLGPLRTVADNWVTNVTTFTTSNSPPPYWRGVVYLRDATGGAAAAGSYVDILFFKVEDITSEAAAAASASAAATSASSAAASQTAAGSSASSAATSATNAATQASNASTSAGQASTSATNAAGSASSAASSATTAASAQGVLVNNMGYQHFTSAIGTKGWGYNNDGTGDLSSYAFVTPAWGDGDYLYRAGGTNLSIFSTQTYPVNPNRKYKFSAEFGAYADGIDDGTTKATFYIGFVGLDNTGTMVSHGSYGSYRYSVTVGEQLYDGQKVTRSTIVTGSGNDSWSKFPPGTTQVRLMAYLNYTNVALGSYLKYITIEDVTDSEAAAGSASAAATSASAASASASGASGSATSATNSANTATTQAGNAASSATAASGSAAAASSSAASALSSMTLAASVVSGGLSPNPVFANWASTAPDTWNANIGVGGSLTKVSGENGFGNAARIVGAAGTESYINTTVGGSGTTGAIVPLGWYIIEADVRLNSGSLSGAAIYLPFYTTAGSGAGYYPVFALSTTSANNTGAPVGAGATGTLYRYRILVQAPATASYCLLYAMGHWSGAGTSMAAANDTTWYRCSMRAASEADLAGYQSLAEVKTLAGAVADIQGRQSAYWQTGAAVGGSSASASITVRADSVTPAASPMTFFGSNVAGNVTTTGRTIKKISGISGDWNYGVWTQESYTAGAYAAVNFVPGSANVMFGLTSILPPAANTGLFYGNIQYAIYFINPGSILIYLSGGQYTGGSAGGGTYFTDANANDTWAVEYLNSGGGTVLFKRNSVVFESIAGVGTGRTFSFATSHYIVGDAVSNVVFAPSGPSSTSSVLIAAQEFAVANGSGTSSKLALRVLNGDAAFSGNIYAGGKIIMGNGNTGWDVAVKPKVLQVTDGQSVAWSNLGYTPNYTFDTTGLAPLGTGETYNCYLDSLSATGATVRCKINVPGTPASYNLTTDAAGGSGNPTRVIDKASNPDASGGSYRYQGTFSTTALPYRADKFSPWYVDFEVNLTLYAKVSGTWTAVGSYTETLNEAAGGGGTQTYTGTFDIPVTTPSGVTHFGADGDCNDLTSVSWTAPGTSSSIRSASPSGQTCKLSVIP